MSVKLRLQRHGAKKRPFYRIVAADIRAPRDGRFLEIIGTYDPNHDPIKLNLKQDRVDYWVSVGAKATDTVNSLLRRARRNPDQVNLVTGSATPRAAAPKAAAPKAAPAVAKVAEAIEEETDA